ncbi:MAG: endonuclease III [Betaproteobacteria bacterium]|nr:endonuclease III [Betaproteobacteria bacterium]
MADVQEILRLLFTRYPEPHIALRFSTPLELLVATILSAQSTDVRVNEVTRELFRKYRTAKDYAEAQPEALEQEIRSTGFYRQKARALIGCGRRLACDFEGRVPASREALVRLPGVGRKTANVVLGSAFGVPAVAVDTHVLRVSARLGLAHANAPEQVEAQLMACVPEDRWTALGLALMLHGRETCTARRPRCCECVLYAPCEWAQKPPCA